MIISEVKTDVIGSGVMESKEFTIRASSKAFRVLSNSLYQNKIQAFIRELSTNALDAQKASGFTGQFEVQLPNFFDPTFKIRDFGPGMSHDSIMELYTTFFESTKDKTNDFIGALGLGSKSPFSYTDSFMVTSYFDGTATYYNMIMKDGLPTVIVMGSSPSDEHSGIEISVAIDLNDITTVKQEASRVFFAFEDGLVPDITGEEIFTTEKYHEKGFFYSSAYSRSMNIDSGVYARMGNIIYPVPSGVTYPDNGIKMYKDNVLVVDFDLGELDIMPSREELSLDNKTKENLIAKLTQTNDNIHELFATKFSHCETHNELWEEIKDQHYTFAIESYLKKTLSIGGVTLSSWLEDIQSLVNRLSTSIVYHNKEKDTIRQDIRYRYNSTRKPFHLCSDSNGDHSVILVNDDDNIPRTSVLALYRAGIVSSDNQVVIVNATKEFSTNMFDEYIRTFDCKELKFFYNSSDYIQNLKKETRKKASPSTRRKNVPMKVNVMYVTGKVTQETIPTEEFLGEKRHVMRYSYSEFVGSNGCHISNFNADVRDYMDVMKIEKLYLLNQSYWTRAMKSDNMIWMMDAMRDYVIDRDVSEFSNFKVSPAGRRNVHGRRWVQRVWNDRRLKDLFFEDFIEAPLHVRLSHSMFLNRSHYDPETVDKIDMIRDLTLENDIETNDYVDLVEKKYPLLTIALAQCPDITDAMMPEIRKILGK